MNIGLLTSWRTQCGIAQYSLHLARALERAGAGTLVLGSRNYGDRALPKEEVAETIGELACFDVELWNQYGHHGLDVEGILALPLDVLHVQYEVVLYNRQRLQQLLDGFQGIKAITYHDNCLPPDMPGPWDLEFRHRDDVGRGRVIPFGIEDVPPLIRTFGLGRSQEEIIRPICEHHGWRFESTFGEREWLSQTDLHNWLREADVIVLWYPEAPMAGSSQAARTALATRRPVIVNDTTWFRDLPSTGAGVCKVPDTPESLEIALLDILKAPYIEECSWDRVASLHLAAYSEARANASTQEDIAHAAAS